MLCVAPAGTVQSWVSAFKCYFCFSSLPAICLGVKHLSHKRPFSSTKPQQIILCRNTQLITQSKEHCIFTCTSRKQHALRMSPVGSIPHFLPRKIHSFSTQQLHFRAVTYPSPFLFTSWVKRPEWDWAMQDVTGPFPNCSMFSRDSYQ